MVAADDPLLREGLALLLRAESMDVVATAETPSAFLAAVDEHQPEVAIVDVWIPPTHTDEGIGASVEVRRCRLSTREQDVLTLTAEGLGNTAIARRLFRLGTGREVSRSSALIMLITRCTLSMLIGRRAEYAGGRYAVVVVDGVCLGPSPRNSSR